MKFQFMSDLHLEFEGLDLKMNIEPAAPVLILAGDITYNNLHTVELFADLAPKFKHIIYVMGNHEYYHGALNEVYRRAEDEASKYPNIHLLENQSLMLADEDGQQIAIHGTTMWTPMGENINHETARLIEACMNDFHRTMDDTVPDALTRFSTRKASEMHDTAIAFLRAACSANVERKQVIVTHHAPHPRSSLPVFAGQALNYAFWSDQTSICEEYAPLVWVHGHMHNSSDYMVGQTRVLANPRGYVKARFRGGNENEAFNPTATFEV